VTAKIYHADIYGSRAHKYKTLLDSSLQDIDWQELSPNMPHYLFVPQEQLHREQYETSWHINEVFPVNTIGVISGQDTKVMAFSEAETKPLAKAFTQTAMSQGLPDTVIKPLLYRPFDKRYIVYHKTAITRTRSEVMRHIVDHNNLVLTFTRSSSAGKPFNHVFSTRYGMVGRFFTDAASITYFAPLWLYPKEGTLEQHAERQPNLAPAFLHALQHAIGSPPTPEDVFHYAYATLHAPTYRPRYAPFLKTDFPRLPLPPDADAFQTLAALGSKLVALHLLEAPSLNPTGIGFPVAGDHTVQKMKDAVRYTPPAQGGTKGRIKLNATEYFDNVPLAAWEFQVGGYRPASKWLADREGRRLSAPDIDHYRRTIAALRETAALLPQVDAAFTAAFPLPAAAQ